MIEFESLWPLAAVGPIALLSIVLGLRAGRRLAPWRRALSITLRVLTLVLLAAALGLPHTRVWRPGHADTVVLIDASESIADEALDRESWPEGRRIVFAGHAAAMTPEVEGFALLHRRALARAREALEQGRTPEAAPEAVEAWRRRIGPWKTDISGALRFARWASAETRIVLFTDGHAPLPPREALAGVRAVPLRNPGGEIAVLSLEGPPVLRPREPFDLTVEYVARGIDRMELELSYDDREKPAWTGEAKVGSGAGRFRIRNLVLPAGMKGGLHRLAVNARAEGDTEARNNRAYFHARVVGKPRVLLLRRPGTRDEAVEAILQAQGMQVEVRPPAALHEAQTELFGFEFVVIVGSPGTSVSPEGWAALRRYVTEGGGLFFLADGSLGDVPIPEALRELLPVRLDPKAAKGREPAPPARKPAGKKVRAPVVAVLLVIDKSGSMAGSNIALAKEACLAAARTLTPKDIVGVLAFDAEPRWVVTPTRAERIGDIETKVLRLNASGGTDIFRALEEVARVFRGIKAAVKHAILLSDGQTPPADFESLVSRMSEEGVTVTTVTLLEGGFDIGLMRRIASLGKGRALHARDPRRLPQVFTSEVRQVLRTVGHAEGKGPVEPPERRRKGEGPKGRRVRLRAGDAHDARQGIRFEEAPPLEGFVPGEGKRTAVVPVVEEGGDPLLAFWRFGLGKVGVWTSDYGGEWSAAFARWGPSARLMAQSFRSVAGNLLGSELLERVRLVARGQEAWLTCDVPPGDEVVARLMYPEQRDLELHRDRDGVFNARFRLEEVGRPVQVTVRCREDTAVVAASAAYPDELAVADINPDFFDEVRRAGGSVVKPEEIGPWPDPAPVERRVELAPWLALLALGLIILDLALRKWDTEA